MSARRRRAVALVLAAAVLAPVSALAGPGDVDAQQRRVVVVGDSVILGAQGPMTAAFAARGWEVTFDAAVSRSTSAGLDAVESHRPLLTDSLVVSLGANDAGNTAAFRERVRAILDAAASVPRVYWVTIREVRDYYGPANQAVRDVAAGRPNVTVLDWHAATAGATDLTAGDGLHLNGAGAARMTQLVTDAVVTGSPPAAAPPPPPTSLPPTTAPPTTPSPTTVPPTTAPPPTTTPPTTAPRNLRSSPAAESSSVSGESESAAPPQPTADRSILAADTIWTVGGGIALVVVVLALSGVALAGWSLVRSHSTQES
jgi:lysophospholipase L1-like esterase